MYSKVFFLLGMMFLACENPQNDDETVTTITGRVSTSPGDTAIVNATISTNPPTSIVSTDNNGVFTISDLNHGVYVVTAVKTGFKSDSVNVTAEKGEIVSSNIYLTRALPAGGPPTVISRSISNIDSVTATGGGNIISDGGFSIIDRGICWSTTQNPTTSDNKTSDGSEVGEFTSSMVGLLPNTTFYVRAYAINTAGTAYGSQVSFTTMASDGTIRDIDGNIYHTVIIGTQVWMVENLKTTKFRNGNSIPNITDNTQWSNLTTSAYCNFNNDTVNSQLYGKLYNWYAVNDSRGIAPQGWHVPSDGEWATLISYLGGDSVAGGKLKEAGFTHWSSPNTGATNESGFTALPGGFRSFIGAFLDTGIRGIWWSTTASDASSGWYHHMFYQFNNVIRAPDFKTSGYSVRCLRN